MGAVVDTHLQPLHGGVSLLGNKNYANLLLKINIVMGFGCVNKF
jgi:hypothetical protein